MINSQRRYFENMKRKNLFFILVSLVLLTTVSCQSEDETTQTSNTEFAEFANVYNSTMSDIFSIGVDKPNNGNNGSGPKKLPDSNRLDTTQQIFIIPNGPGYMEEQFTGCTLVELVDFAESVDATLSSLNDGTAVDSVLVSETEAREKLDPMVEQAWKYLRSRGMTTSEIQAMLDANNADETELVPLMLAIMDYEGEFDKGTVSYSPPSTNPNEPTQDKQLDLEKVGKCALQAIGADIFHHLLLDGVKVISKKLAIELFTVVAEKYAGPIAVVVAVVEFANCMGYI